MPSVDAGRLGAELDENHHVETNGRMAVCRRCGGVTDGPSGEHHAPHEGQLTRIGQWLDLVRSKTVRGPLYR